MLTHAVRAVALVLASAVSRNLLAGKAHANAIQLGVPAPVWPEEASSSEEDSSDEES
jgi:hypothetical protein